VRWPTNPDGNDAHLVFEPRPGAYNDEMLIEFLSDVNAIEQRRVLLIWDGLFAHRSRRMTAWVQTQRHWLSVERLPGYAHDLNPIENVWGNLKSQELANLCAEYHRQGGNHRRRRTGPNRHRRPALSGIPPSHRLAPMTRIHRRQLPKRLLSAFSSSKPP
jgi:transposase